MLKTIPKKLLQERIAGLMQSEETPGNMAPELWDALTFANVIEGEVIHACCHGASSGMNMEHDIMFAIIENPTYRITDRQLCDIMDEGNHCISQGSITYEQASNGKDYAYIHWSNNGHI